VPRSNDEVGRTLQEYADLLSLLSDDRFKPRAYEKAARAVGGEAEDLTRLDDAGIRAIPHVGTSIAEKINAILDSGTFAELEELRRQVPAGVRDMTAIPGFGPKKAMAVYRELGIEDADALVAAAQQGELRRLKGFSARSEELILAAVARARRDAGRVRIDQALEIAETLLGSLRSLSEVRGAEYAGSLRRSVETIGDVDLLVASDRPVPVMGSFVESEVVAQVLAHGERKSSIVTRDGLQVDLRVVSPAAWGAAILYFTGSKAHNVRIREMAVREGLKLNEYGLFVADTGELLTAETEEAIYARLGMDWIAPPLREDRGEIEAASNGTLPQLVELGDVRGDLHTHTDLTDGTAPLARMVEAAAARGYTYYAVTDHAPNLTMQRMTDEKILAQRTAIGRLQRRYPTMTLLHGTELNIDPEGNVDWPPEFLERFDLTVASVHSHLGLERDAMTRRVIRAMEHPNVHVIGHLTTRQIGRRDPVDLDLEAVFAAAARTGTALEIDASPSRLDLRDEHVLWAARHGVRFAVNSDAHSVAQLDVMRYGLGVAQRGWLTKAEVINTWTLPRLRRFLAGKRA
jgi:DNA polymerase (family 10)